MLQINAYILNREQPLIPGHQEFDSSGFDCRDDHPSSLRFFILYNTPRTSFWSSMYFDWLYRFTDKKQEKSHMKIETKSQHSQCSVNEEPRDN